MLSYSEGEAVMARWPGTKLYYAATVAGLLPDTREYEVRHASRCRIFIEIRHRFRPAFYKVELNVLFSGPV